MKIEIKHKPQGEILYQYMDSWSRVEMIMGPLGSGKTIQSCLKLLMAMVNQMPNDDGVRPTRFYAVRNTYPDLTSTTIKDWRGLFDELGTYKAGGMEPPTHHINFDLDDGSEVKSELVFIALDRPDAIKRLRGAQVTGFWLNEVKELNKSVVDMADMRHGRYPSLAIGGIEPTWHGMIGDTNAPDDDHWYYRLAEVDKPQGWRFHRQPGGLYKSADGIYLPNMNAENLQNLPDGYYINGQAGKSKDWIDVNLCNEYGFVQDGKPVYPEYIDSIHCLPEDYTPDINLPLRVGVDFGRTPAAAILQYVPGLGRYVGVDEFLGEDMSAAIFAPQLKKYLDRNYAGFTFEVGGGDPAGLSKGQATEDTPFTILRKFGILVRPAHSNDPLLRRASIVNLLKELCMDGKPAFMISPKCKRWRKGLAGGFKYRRIQVVGDEKYSDEPDKNKYSHICEAGEYGLMAAGEGRKALRPSTPIRTKPVIARMDFDVFS